MENYFGECSSNSTNARLLKLEEEIINIHTRIDELTKKKPKRKTNTISDLDTKLCTILDILVKLGVPEEVRCSTE